MTKSLFYFPSPFSAKAKTKKIEIIPLTSSSFKKLDRSTKDIAKVEGFEAKVGQILITNNYKTVYAGISSPVNIYDFARTADAITKKLSTKTIKDNSFTLKTGKDNEKLLIGWALASYRYTTYKKSDYEAPTMVWPKGVNKKRVKAFAESISLVKNLINTPAIDLGPSKIEKVIKDLAKKHEAKCKVIKGAILEKDFPLVHTVGMACTDKPRLIELNWGDTKNPKLCLVGKGVTFDTGGLNIKPTQYMATMKKDMGGAAHVIALANLIMHLKLPVNLTVLVPAVENSIAGNAFRPGDIIKSRSGITVENKNTDAEGRLILADALTYACEKKPDLIIDCATLTGSARAALGQDIPAFFSNNDKNAKDLQNISFKEEDPLWQMPLWEDYNKHIKSDIADLVNSASIPGDLIYSALFLQSFVDDKFDWMHLDMFAWETSGKPGRPKGGADSGLRALFAYLERKYG
jgi:leucyl aminopeptidase